MLVISLNVRGIGGTLKVSSVHRLLNRTRPDVILLQETMVEEQKERDFMHLFRLNWVSSSISSVGTSGGLLAAWDPLLFELDPYLTVGGILLTWKSLLHNWELTILNIYGPCKDKKLF